MEGVPRMPMLEVELKHNSIDYSSLDWAGMPSEDVHEVVQGQITEALKKHIREEYGDNPDKFTDAIDKLIEVQTAAYKAILSPDFEGCNSLKKYYGQLHYMQTRFPFTGGDGLKVTFTWQDAFTGILTVHETFAFEQTAILFNIGAIHSTLGAADTRLTEEGIRISCVHFQCAAGLFTYIAHNFDTTLSPDIGQQVLKLFINVMLAQGQECLLEKSMQDNRKHSIVCKISQQVVDYYKLCVQYLENREAENVLGSSAYKMWRKMINFKISYYSAITKYFMGHNALDQDKYGQAVSYFGAAVSHLTELTKQAKNFPKETRTKIEEALRFTADVLNGKYNSSVKDNNFVYHDKVPDAATLPEVKGASLVKALPFEPANESLTGPDIFSKLVPMEAHLAASTYSEEKAKLLRTVVEKIDEKDNTLSEYKTSIELDPKKLISPDEPAKLDPTLVEKCATFSVDQSPISELKEAMDGLTEVYNDLDAVLNDILTIVENEETEDLKFQKETTGKDAFSTQEDVEGIKKELAVYKELYQKASQMNDDLQTACRIHVQNMKAVAGGMDSLKQELKLTDIGELLTEEDRSVIELIRKLCEKVIEMEDQRTNLLQQLRQQMESDDVTSTLVTKHGVDQEDLFQEELKKYDQLIDTIDKNLAAQDNILGAVTEANARYTKIRKIADNEKERVDQRSSNLVLSCDAVEEVRGKCREGAKFFGEVLSKAKELYERSKEFHGENEAKRKNIYKKIEEKKKPPPRPVAPKPKLNVPKKPTSTPATAAPAPGMVLSPDVLAKMMAEDDDELLNDPEFLQFLQNQGDLHSMDMASSLPGSAPGNPMSMPGLGPLPSRPHTMPPASYHPSIQSPIHPAVSSPAPGLPQNYQSGNAPLRPPPQPTPPQVMSPQPRFHSHPPQFPGMAHPGAPLSMGGPPPPNSQPGQILPDPRQFQGLPQQGSFPLHPPTSQVYTSFQPGVSAAGSVAHYQGQLQQPHMVHSQQARPPRAPAPQPMASIPQSVNQVPQQPQVSTYMPQMHVPHGVPQMSQPSSMTPQVDRSMSQAMQQHVPSVVPSQQTMTHMPQQGRTLPQPMHQNAPFPASTYQPVAQPMQHVPSPAPSHQTMVPAAPTGYMPPHTSQSYYTPGQAMAPVSQPQALQHNYYMPQQSAPVQRQQPIQVSQVAIVYSSQPPCQQSVTNTYSQPGSGYQTPLNAIPGSVTGVHYSQSDSVLQMKNQPHTPHYGGGYPSPAPTPPGIVGHPQQNLQPSTYPAPQSQMSSQQTYPTAPTPPPASVSSYQPQQQQQYIGQPGTPHQFSSPQPQVLPQSQGLSQPQQNIQPGFNHPNQPVQNFRPVVSQGFSQQPTLVSQHAMVRPPMPGQQQHPGAPQQTVLPRGPAVPQQVGFQDRSGQQAYQTQQQNLPQTRPTVPQQFGAQHQQDIPRHPLTNMGQNLQQHGVGVPQQANQVYQPQPGVPQMTGQPRMPHPANQIQQSSQSQPIQAPYQQPSSNQGRHLPGSTIQQPWNQAPQQQSAHQPQNVMQATPTSMPQMSSSMPHLAGPVPQQHQPLEPQGPTGAPNPNFATNLQENNIAQPQNTGATPLGQPRQSVPPASVPNQQESYTFKSHPHPGQFMSTPSNESSPKHVLHQTGAQKSINVPPPQPMGVLTPTPVNEPPPPKPPLPKQPSSDLAGLILTPTRTLSSSADELLFTSPDQGPNPAKNTTQVVLVPTKVDEIDERMVVRPVEGLPYMDDADLMKFKGQVSEFRTKVSNLLHTPENHGLCELDKEWKQLSEAQERHSRKLSTAIARCSSYKNRYQDIVPFDQSRVILKEAKDDYINASVIDGVSPYCPRFIATQSPLPNTISDFWLMIYEQQVNLIVMLVNSKDVPRKCPMYWPVDRTVPQQHGPLTVSFTTSKAHGDLYIERTFTVKHKNQSLAMSVTQLQYIAWPEHRFPSSASDLLSFVSVVQSFHSSQRNLQWPVLVHCESGVGRTGVFCAFVAGINEINAGMGIMDVLEILNKMREKRKYMVQEKAQLKFVYDVILYHAIDMLKQRKIILVDDVKPTPAPQQVHPHTEHQPNPRGFDIFSNQSALYSIQATVEKMTIKSGVEKGPMMQMGGFTTSAIESKSTSDIPNSDSLHSNMGPVVRPSTSEIYPTTTIDVTPNFNSQNSTPSNIGDLSDLVQGTIVTPIQGYMPSVPNEISSLSQPDIVESCNNQVDSKLSETSQHPGQSEGPLPRAATSSPASLIESLTPEAFTLNTEEDAAKKKKITKEDFYKPRTGLNTENDPSDPFGGLDPLWGLRK